MSTQEIPAICTDPTKRHDFVILFDVTMGNPNGDPDAENLPRVDPETMHGIVTDVALKRKVRNYVQLSRPEMPIFIQSAVALNTLITKGFIDSQATLPRIQLDDPDLVEWFQQNECEGFGVGADGTLVYAPESRRPSARDILAPLLEVLRDEPESEAIAKKLQDVATRLAAEAKRPISDGERENAKKRLCHDYYDIRVFGAVLATGLNAGQVRGPMQLTFARSIDPVFQNNLTITRQARTTRVRMTTGGTEMGRKPIIPYGLYRAHGFFSPQLAKTTVVTAGDLEVFWRALMEMFEFDRSAARGEMATRGLFIFTHDNPLGNAPAHKLFERIHIGRRADVPRSFRDYTVEIDESGLPQGITLSRLVS